MGGNCNVYGARLYYAACVFFTMRLIGNDKTKGPVPARHRHTGISASKRPRCPRAGPTPPRRAIRRAAHKLPDFDGDERGNLYAIAPCHCHIPSRHCAHLQRRAYFLAGSLLRDNGTCESPTGAGPLLALASVHMALKYTDSHAHGYANMPTHAHIPVLKLCYLLDAHMIRT